MPDPLHDETMAARRSCGSEMIEKAPVRARSLSAGFMQLGFHSGPRHPVALGFQNGTCGSNIGAVWHALADRLRVESEESIQKCLGEGGDGHGGSSQPGAAAANGDYWLTRIGIST